MNELRKAAEMALEALEDVPLKPTEWSPAVEALRQALAQPVDAVNMSQERVDETSKGEHEPVAWFRYESSYEYQNQLTRCTKDCIGAFPVYTAPPKREWVGLTDEEIDEKTDFRGTIRYFEAKLREKNA